MSNENITLSKDPVRLEDLKRRAAQPPRTAPVDDGYWRCECGWSHRTDTHPIQCPSCQRARPDEPQERASQPLAALRTALETIRDRLRGDPADFETAIGDVQFAYHTANNALDGRSSQPPTDRLAAPIDDIQCIYRDGRGSQPAERDDTARLQYVMRNVSGRALRDAWIEYSAGDLEWFRIAIDNAIERQTPTKGANDAG